MDTVTLDLSTLKLTVLEPGSSTAVDYTGGTLINDKTIGGRIQSSLPPAPGDPEPAQKTKIINIDRTTGAFSTTELVIYKSKPLQISQAIGTCVKGDRLF